MRLLDRVEGFLKVDETQKKSGCLCARALSVRIRRLHKWFCVPRSCPGSLLAPLPLRTPQSMHAI